VTEYKDVQAITSVHWLRFNTKHSKALNTTFDIQILRWQNVWLTRIQDRAIYIGYSHTSL